MRIRCFSFVFATSAALAAPALAGPISVGERAPSSVDAAIVLVQSVKERDLEAVPPIDSGREQPLAPRTSPPAYSAPPPPPPVPPAPRYSTRTAPPPADDDTSAPPAREVPPPPLSTTRVSPPSPPRLTEPAPVYRAAPRDEGPSRRADAPRRIPSPRSAFDTNCTAQCHLSCEASFEVCNGDASPAKPACVKKLEACRVERCACRFE